MVYYTLENAMGDMMGVRRGRGKSKKAWQSEKLLLILLDGHEAPVHELESLLSSEIVFSRMSSYLWDLKRAGANILRTRTGRKIVSYQLVNVVEMRAYALKRKLIAPPPVRLTAADFAVSA